MSKHTDALTLSTPTQMQTYAQLIGIQSSLLVQTVPYHDVKCAILVEPSDPFLQMIMDGLEELTSRNASKIRPLGSMATLFNRGDEMPRTSNQRLFIAISLRGGVDVLASCLSCVFAKDATFGTSLFSRHFCSKHGLPRLDTKWWLIDVASSTIHSGALVILHAILSAARAKLTGVCAVAMGDGLRLLRSMNFTCVPFHEGARKRHVCFMNLRRDLSFTKLNKQLRFAGDARMIDSAGWNPPLSTRAVSSVIGWC